MDMKKYEQLINLVINENEEQAKELFHEIVVEKSREIFESIMAEEDDMMDEGMGGQVGDLLDEISAEESGVMEEEDDMDFEFDDESVSFDDEDMGDHHSDVGGNEEFEDTVIRIEDKLDQLMAEFEEIMGSDELDSDEDEDMDSDEEDMDMDMDSDEEDMDMDLEMDDEETDEVMEAVQLQKVSVTHGDNGSNTKSPNVNNSGQAGMDSKPVKFSGASETVPTGPKGPSNFYSKGEKEVPGAGKFKNAPGHKSQDLDSAPKPKHGDNGVNTKSPVAESRRNVRRPIR
jgi:hypothetical protein